MNKDEIIIPSVQIWIGHNLKKLMSMKDNSVDSVVTDCPYGLGKEPDPVKVLQDWIDHSYHEIKGKGFMGNEWDAFVPQPRLWKEVFRVLKPGGHVLAFFGTRTYDWGVMAMRFAGFEIRDQIDWIYGTGFPKSLDVSKAIDKQNGTQMGWFGPWLREERKRRGITQKSLSEYFPSKTGGLTGCVANWELGLTSPTREQFNKLCQVLELPFEHIDEAEREIIGTRKGTKLAVAPGQENGRGTTHLDITLPSSEKAKQWDGWGTALKPAHEPICLARKPLIGTVAENVITHSTGALNINDSRIEFHHESDYKSAIYGNGIDIQADPLGRWPANIIHDGSEEVLRHFPNTELGKPSGTKSGNNNNVYGQFAGDIPVTGYGDKGSAARFFYCAKATKQDRDEGLEHLEDKTGGMISDTSGQHITRREEGYKPEPRKNNHPTVKPTALMRWLIRLITPPGGIVLDPFAGSGSTGKAAVLEGFDSILLELDQDADGKPLGYKEIIEGRTKWAQDQFQQNLKVINIRNEQISLF